MSVRRPGVGETWTQEQVDAEMARVRADRAVARPLAGSEPTPADYVRAALTAAADAAERGGEVRGDGAARLDGAITAIRALDVDAIVASVRK